MSGNEYALELDLIQTAAATLSVLFLGYLLTRLIPVLRKFSIPEPVVGGIAFALVSGLVYTYQDVSVSFDMSLMTPLMLVFFTTVGLGANVKLLIKGGPKVFIFLGVTSAFLFVQNAISVIVALLADLHPIQGLLSASITMSGGHGTGATYAEVFSNVNNLQSAMEIAMASATFGLVLGGLIGGPVAKRLIDKYELKPATTRDVQTQGVTYDPEDTDHVTPRRMLETLLIIVLCITIGNLLYGVLRSVGITAPSFICALFLGMIVTNVLEVTKIYKINKETIDQWGTMSLSIFLAMALMSLRLRELLNLAGPMLLLLAVQTVALAAFAYHVTFRVMGKDYDAAIIASGHCGFGLGATPTAVANMEALVSRYGASPQAFFVVPLVGAFFLDITNALVIQLFLGLPFVVSPH